jgi:type VI secretion system protein ImpG
VLTDYYKQELKKLREIAKDFSKENPAITRALTGVSADPDASKILEGVAFLTANIRQELDTQFPKLLYSLAQVVCPQYIRPLPSATMIAFSPKPSLAKPLVISKGTYIDSKETARGTCRFKTVDDIEMLPINLKNVVEHSRNGDINFSLQFELVNQTLDQLPFGKLRLYVGGEYEEAADILYLLTTQLKQISVSTSQEVALSTNCLTASGIENQQSIYPQPDGLMPAFDLLQQYFLFPEKFLYIDIDLKHWIDRGTGDSFSINMTVKKPNIEIPELTKEYFHLFVAPAVNLFECDSEAVLLSASKNEYQLTPNTGSNKATFDIYSVDKVESNARGMEKPRGYQLFGGFSSSSDSDSVFEIDYKNIHKATPDVFLKLAFAPNHPLEQNEILKAKLTCSNGALADKLHVGDISVATSNTPELANFYNITSPTVSRRIPLDGDLLWKLISNLSLNYLSITNADTLKSILRQYIAPDSKAKSQRLTNEKRIDSIANVSVNKGERLFNNAFIHGQNITLTIKPEHFSSPGDKHLFCSVLDKFFASCSAINVYSEFSMEDFFSGEVSTWPAQLGTRSMQ